MITELEKKVCEQKDYDFTFFVDLSIKNSETLCVFNSIKSQESKTILFPVIFIRKYACKYYFWNTNLSL
jgi:hypothetical protein